MILQLVLVNLRAAFRWHSQIVCINNLDLTFVVILSNNKFIVFDIKDLALRLNFII